MKQRRNASRQIKGSGIINNNSNFRISNSASKLANMQAANAAKAAAKANAKAKAEAAALQANRNAKKAREEQERKNRLPYASMAREAKNLFMTSKKKAGKNAVGKTIEARRKVNAIIGSEKGKAALRNKGIDPQNYMNFVKITKNSNVLSRIFNSKFRPTKNHKDAAAALLVKNYNQFLSKNQKNALKKLNATRGRPFTATGPVRLRYQHVINNPNLTNKQIIQLLHINPKSALNMSTKSSVAPKTLTTISTILKNRGITPPKSFKELTAEKGWSN